MWNRKRTEYLTPLYKTVLNGLSLRTWNGVIRSSATHSLFLLSLEFPFVSSSSGLWFQKRYGSITWGSLIPYSCTETIFAMIICRLTMNFFITESKIIVFLNLVVTVNSVSLDWFQIILSFGLFRIFCIWDAFYYYYYYTDSTFSEE